MLSPVINVQVNATRVKYSVPLSFRHERKFVADKDLVREGWGKPQNMDERVFCLVQLAAVLGQT
jgi:hypothetical protein